MWFLIKGSFWFGLVLVILSFFSGESTTQGDNQAKLQFGDVFVAATGAYDYLTGMCGEKPEVCLKGGETMSALGHRALAGARVAYELLDSQFGDGTAAKPIAAPHATIPGRVALAPAHPENLAPGQNLAQERTTALNQPMPYRPPVDDGEEISSDAVTTGTISLSIPLPTPRPAT